jgi:hypothetical protein
LITTTYDPLALLGVAEGIIVGLTPKAGLYLILSAQIFSGDTIWELRHDIDESSGISFEYIYLWGKIIMHGHPQCH